MGNSLNPMIQAGAQTQNGSNLPMQAPAPPLQITPPRPMDTPAIQTAAPVVHQNAFYQRPDIKQQNYNANMDKLHTASNRRQQLGRQQAMEPRPQAVPYPSIGAMPAQQTTAQQAQPVSMPAQQGNATNAQQTAPTVGADANQDALRRQGLQYLIG